MRLVARAPNVMGGVKNSIFESFRSPAPKLALVPGAASTGGPGYPSHPLSILMRLATYLYILYIYVVVLAASWHKS